MYSIAVYWIVGLYRSPGNFFSWVCVLWSLSNCEREGGARPAGVPGDGCTGQTCTLPSLAVYPVPTFAAAHAR